MCGALAAEIVRGLDQPGWQPAPQRTGRTECAAAAAGPVRAREAEPQPAREDR